MSSQAVENEHTHTVPFFILQIQMILSIVTLYNLPGLYCNCRLFYMTGMHRMRLCQLVSLNTPNARAVFSKNLRVLCISNIAIVIFFTIVNILTQLGCTVQEAVSGSMNEKLQVSCRLVSLILPVLTLTHICAAIVAIAISNFIGIHTFCTVHRTVDSHSSHFELEATRSSNFLANTRGVALGIPVLDSVEIAGC